MIKNQNRIISLIVIILYAVIFFKLQASDIAKIQLLNKHYHIKDLKLQDFDGKFFPLKNKESKFYIINLWASWCAPCIKEMKSLDALKKAVPAISVITVSQDNDVKDAEEFFIKNKYNNLEKYYDFDKKFISTIKVRGLPTTFIANSKYKIFAKVEGIIEWDSKIFIEWKA